MFEKDLHIAYLLDFYGEVLPEKINRVMTAYYEEDLSLAEIAAGEDISRQGVRHLIKRGEEQLRIWEEKLGLAAHYSSLSVAADKLEELAQKTVGSDGAAQALCETALDCVKLMRNS